jgi:hypothetical protein
MNLRAVWLWGAQSRKKRVTADPEKRGRGRYEAGAAGPKKASVVVVI